MAQAELTRSNEEWSTVIEAKASWLNLRLEELWEYRGLVLLLVRRDFVAQYKQTILGPLWFLIQPLLNTIVFTIVFGNIARLPTDEVPPFLFYLTGTVIWSYFASCLTSTSNTFITNAQLFGKVYFPRLVVPLSYVLSNLITFSLQLLVLLICVGFFYSRGAPIQPQLALFPLLPLLVLLMAGLGLGIGQFISSLTTRYRDLALLVTFGTQLLMYATPVIYPLSAVPAEWRWLAAANPISAVVEGFRHIILGAGTISPGHLAYSVGAMLALVIGGTLLFNRVERSFMDTI